MTRSRPARCIALLIVFTGACSLESAGTGGGGGGGGGGGSGNGNVGSGSDSIGVPFSLTPDFTAIVSQVPSGDTIVLADGTRIQYGDAVAPAAGSRCAQDATDRNTELVLNQEVGIVPCDPDTALLTTAEDTAPIRAHVVRIAGSNLVPGTLVLEGWLLPDAVTTCTSDAHDFYTDLTARADTANAGSFGPNCIEDPVGSGRASIDAEASVFDAPGDDVSNLNGEIVVIRADGGHVELTGWKLSDALGQIYTFPPFVLFSGRTVAVHTGAGVDTATELYWNLGVPAWSESGDRASLIDAEGRLIDSVPVG